MKRVLPTDSAERKKIPLWRGCFRYAPAALAGMARISHLGNEKHNPGEELHHARGKSSDHGDCILRHLIDADELMVRIDRQVPPWPIDATTLNDELDQLMWRTALFVQEAKEKYCGAPLAPGARLSKVDIPGLTPLVANFQYPSVAGIKHGAVPDGFPGGLKS